MKKELTKRDRNTLERALCILADYEGLIKRTLAAKVSGGSDYDHHHVCAALRILVDGEDA